MHRKIVIALLALALPMAAMAQEAKKPPEPLKIKVGDMAPDFELLAYDGTGVKPVKLSDFRGKKQVAVAFFVFAFTGG
jgi:hypothetical protein